MSWCTPDYSEIKMDAEIGSYQEDRDSDREPPVVSSDAVAEEGGAR